MTTQLQILIRFVCALVFIFPVTANANEKARYSIKNSIELSGVELNVVSVALEDFRKSKFDLKNYRIFIIRQKDQYEIIFLPNLRPGEKSSFGGGTELGDELHYFVSKNGVIIKMEYAR
ncbi:hypothetical protein [Undibacterium flavidum]|uniref:Uncharacterized protein n=1 Tax=Undibacterium flavidum TaxID=2762297 RepID=A0ABR6YEF5_9BURK|nr:hypothetical protein [Undibacterium flavidum]MBC3874908.1 hypothetical protein [Undibacterium flavidum]